MKVGIVGNNLYGQIFFRTLESFEDVQVTAVCPELGESMESFSERQRLKIFENFPKMVEESGLDIVVLASVTALHAQQAVAAMQAGAHVLVDRPIALSLDECDWMMAEAQRVNRLLMIGHVLQFWPEYIIIRKMIAQRVLGIVHAGTGWRISGALNRSWQGRLLHPRYGLGCLEAHFHDIDYLNTLFGKPASITALGTQTAQGSWKQVHSLLKYANGLHISMEANYSVPLNYPLNMHLRLDGDKGTVVFNFQGALAAQGNAQRTLVEFLMEQDPKVVQVEIKDGYVSMVSHFLDCIRNGQSPAFGTPEQSRDALQVLLAISEAAQTGKSVSL
jgi:predicted dehydrogenase